MSPSTKLLSRISDVLGSHDVAPYLAGHDYRLRDNRCLDLPVFTHRQRVLVQIDLAFDLTVDHQILVPGQLAFDDD